MNKLIGILIAVFIIAGCKKDKDENHHEGDPHNGNNKTGNLVLNMSYQSAAEKSSVKSAPAKTGPETFYTQFGDYITSITPSAFIGKFLDMRLFNFGVDDTIWNYGFNIIDNNTPIDSSNRLADFINQSTVDFNLNPDIIPQGSDGVFNIFVFISLFFYQEFELPAPYDTVLNLAYLDFGNNNMINSFDGHFIGGNRTGLIVKGSGDPFLAPVFDPAWTGLNVNFPPIPKNFVFGSCDSTYLFFSDTVHQLRINNPLGQYGYIVRSNTFNTITIHLPEDGEDIKVNGSMAFDTHRLIQVYAGADNVPYTLDDVFVYAPNFWERFSVQMSVE